MNWMAFHSDGKHLHHRLLPAIHQFCDSEQQGISDCEPCYPCLYFEEKERLKQCQSSHDSLSH